MDTCSSQWQDEEVCAFLIAWVTYHTRVSERMVSVRRGETVWLEAAAEMQITQSIARIVEEDEVQILAYNICGDHVHLVLVCGEEEAPKMVQKLKVVSVKEYHVSRGMTRLGVTEQEHKEGVNEQESQKNQMNKGVCCIRNSLYEGEQGVMTPCSKRLPKKGVEQNHLWAQKCNIFYIYGEKQFQSAVQYVEYNRAKHGLAEKKELQSLIQKMICSYEEAFSLSQMPCS